MIKLVQPFSGNRKKGGAENIALQNLRVPGMEVSGNIALQNLRLPGMEVSGIFFPAELCHFKRPPFRLCVLYKLT